MLNQLRIKLMLKLLVRCLVKRIVDSHVANLVEVRTYHLDKQDKQDISAGLSLLTVGSDGQ